MSKYNRQIVDEEFLKQFAILYNSYKNQGCTPTRIITIITDSYKCSNTTYYHYLYLARKNNYIDDSYEQNRKEMIERYKYMRNNEIMNNKLYEDYKYISGLICKLSPDQIKELIKVIQKIKNINIKE